MSVYRVTTDSPLYDASTGTVLAVIVDAPDGTGAEDAAREFAGVPDFVTLYAVEVPA